MNLHGGLERRRLMGARIPIKSRMSETPLWTRESLDPGPTHVLSVGIRLVNEGVRLKQANYEWL